MAEIDQTIGVVSIVVDEGDFIDMRHLLDRSTVRQAFFGLSYIQSFRRDPRGYRGVASHA